MVLILEGLLATAACFNQLTILHGPFMCDVQVLGHSAMSSSLTSGTTQVLQSKGRCPWTMNLVFWYSARRLVMIVLMQYQRGFRSVLTYDFRLNDTYQTFLGYVASRAINESLVYAGWITTALDCLCLAPQSAYINAQA